MQPRSQSPRYPYPAEGTGNTDLWNKAFRHERILRMSGGTLYPRIRVTKGNED